MLDWLHLTELIFVSGCTAAIIVLAWSHSIYRKHNVPTRAVWTVLMAVCFGTAYANVRRAGTYLGEGCAVGTPGNATMATLLLLAYLPVLVILSTLLLIILATTALIQRRKKLGKPKMYAALIKLLHKMCLVLFQLSCHPTFVVYHIAVVCIGWVVEPFLILGTWHLVGPECRDYRVFAACCAGLEVALSIPRVVMRTAVSKELKYEAALLRVDATTVRYMEVTTCARCGLQFFGSPEKGLGLAGEGRAQFVDHFFAAHGEQIAGA